MKNMDKVFYKDSPGIISVMISKGAVNLEQYVETNNPESYFYIAENTVIQKCRYDIAQELILEAGWSVYIQSKTLKFTVQEGMTMCNEDCPFYISGSKNSCGNVNGIFDCHKYNLTTLKWIED